MEDGKGGSGRGREEKRGRRYGDGFGDECRKNKACEEEFGSSEGKGHTYGLLLAKRIDGGERVADEKRDGVPSPAANAGEQDRKEEQGSKVAARSNHPGLLLFFFSLTRSGWATLGGPGRGKVLPLKFLHGRHACLPQIVNSNISKFISGQSRGRSKTILLLWSVDVGRCMPDDKRKKKEEKAVRARDVGGGDGKRHGGGKRGWDIKMEERRKEEGRNKKESSMVASYFFVP